MRLLPLVHDFTGEQRKFRYHLVKQFNNTSRIVQRPGC